MLHHRRGADGEIGAIFLDCGNVLLETGAELHLHAARFEPFAVGIRPLRARGCSADVRHLGPAFDQQARHQQLRAFIARNRDAALDRHLFDCAAAGRNHRVLHAVDLRLRQAERVAQRLQPGSRAIRADRSRTDDRAAGGFEFADRGGVEGVDRGDDGAVERGIELAPFAGRHHRANGQTQGREQLPDHHRISREHFAQQRHGGLVGAFARRRNRTGFHLLAGILQHRAGQHVLRLGMGRDAEARHVDADDAHAVDLLLEQPQRHAARRGDAQVGDHDRVVSFRIGEVFDRFLDVLEQLAGDQRFRGEGHIAHRPPRAVEVRGEGQAIDAAGRARQHGRGAPHPEAHPQRPEGGAHGLRLVMRADRIIGRILIEDIALACGAGSLGHGVLGRAATFDRGRAKLDPVRGAVAAGGEGVAHRIRPRRRPLRGWHGFRTRRPAYRPGWRGRVRHCRRSHQR